MSSRSFQLVCLLAFIGLMSGCGRQPQMAAPNRKILEALQTAVSSKQTEWLDAVVRQVEEKRDKKEMSDQEFRAIDAIIKKAKSGDWKAARTASFALSDGQRPTSAEVSDLKKRRDAKGP